jgi:hypothetical protein
LYEHAKYKLVRAELLNKPKYKAIKIHGILVHNFTTMTNHNNNIRGMR